MNRRTRVRTCTGMLWRLDVKARAATKALEHISSGMHGNLKDSATLGERMNGHFSWQANYVLVLYFSVNNP